MTNVPSNLITVGRITGVFGIKGWVKVLSSTEPVEQILNYAPWWLKTRHGVKAVEIDEYLLRPQGLVVHIKGMDDRNEAEDLGRVDIAVEKAQLPELENGEYYWHQLLGMRVISQFDGQEYDFGRVDKILETGANDVLVAKPDASSEIGIENGKSKKEYLVPWIPGTYIKEVKLAEGTIIVEWDPDF